MSPNSSITTPPLKKCSHKQLKCSVYYDSFTFLYSCNCAIMFTVFCYLPYWWSKDCLASKMNIIQVQKYFVLFCFNIFASNSNVKMPCLENTIISFIFFVEYTVNYVENNAKDMTWMSSIHSSMHWWMAGYKYKGRMGSVDAEVCTHMSPACFPLALCQLKWKALCSKYWFVVLSVLLGRCHLLTDSPCGVFKMRKLEGVREKERNRGV